MALQQGILQPGMMPFHAGLQHQGIAPGTTYMNSAPGQPGAVSYHGMQPGMVPGRGIYVQLPDPSISLFLSLVFHCEIIPHHPHLML